MHVSAALLALAASGAAAAPFDIFARAANGLNAAAQAAGKLYFGTAVDNGDLNDQTYLSILKNTADFGQITPANSMKWDAIEPSRGQFTFSAGDTVANLAAQNGQKLRCHNLVWYSQLPSWVTNGNFDNATLISIMKNHITTTVNHYKGKCYAWDVVNEAINDDSTGSLRQSVFLKTIGPAYIPIAFATAREADPDVKLYYNDYNIETAGAKSTAAQNIVKMIKAYGAPIDGVGLQSHFIGGQTPSTAAQMSNMQAFTALGVDVAITELDIRIPTPATTSSQAQQATDYQNTIAACAKVARCVGVTIWDFTDKYSWIPSVFSGYGSALPWDSNEQKKTNVYNAIIAGWAQGGGSSSTTTTTGPTSTSGPTTTTTQQTTTTSSPPSSGSGASHWGQCGGQGWTGPTTCQSPYTCQALNPYYSQCL